MPSRERRVDPEGVWGERETVRDPNQRVSEGLVSIWPWTWSGSEGEGSQALCPGCSQREGEGRKGRPQGRGGEEKARDDQGGMRGHI